MANNEVTLSSSEVTERVITNLYLYGQVAPLAYPDRLLPSAHLTLYSR